MSKKTNFAEFYYTPRDLAKIPWWLQILDSFGLKNVSRVEKVGELLEGGENMLDIGCGDGELIVKYGKDKFKHCEGIDISPKLIDANNKKLKKNSSITFTVADFENYNSKKHFDAITATAYLEHVPFPIETLTKMNKLLNKGGCVILEMPNVGYLFHRISLLFGKFPETAPTEGNIPGVDEEHLRFFTVETLIKILEKTGFRVDLITTSGRLSGLRKYYVSLLGADLVVKATKL